MTREQFTAMLLESITCVLREKAAKGKIIIASIDSGGLERLALELTNNAAQAPLLEMEIMAEERDAIATTLDSAGIDREIDGDPLELPVRVGMLRNRVLHATPAAPAVVRGPIALKTCACTTAVFTCSNCNGLPKEQGNGTEA